MLGFIGMRHAMLGFSCYIGINIDGFNSGEFCKKIGQSPILNPACLYIIIAYLMTKFL